MSFWAILGIEQTTDLKLIKRAYAKRTKHYHPEEDPENFQKLQKAYQAALAWRKERLEAEVYFEEKWKKAANTSQVVSEATALEPEESSPQPKKPILNLAKNQQDLAPDQEETPQTVAIDDLEDASSKDREDESSETVLVDELAVSPEPSATIFKDDIAEDLEQQDGFLQEVGDFFRENMLTVSYMSYFVKRAKAQGWLDDQAFVYQLSQIFLPHLQKEGLKGPDLEAFRKVALQFELTPIRDYLDPLLGHTAVKIGAVPSLEPSQADRSHQPGKAGRKGGAFSALLLFAIVCAVVGFLASGAWRQMPSTRGTSSYSVPSSSISTPSFNLDNEKVKQIAGDLAERMDKSPQTIDDNHRLIYDDSQGLYLIEDQTSGIQIPLTDVVKARVLTFHDNGQESKGIVITKDNENWEVCDLSGQVLGPVVQETPVSSYTEIYVENGSYFNREKGQ